MIDDETAMRRVDGELTADEAEAIDVAAAADPALAARLEQLRRLRAATRAAFPAAPDPRDADLARMIAGGGAASRSWTARFGDRLSEAFAPRHAPLWAAGAAACFVLGLAVGGLGREPAPAGFAVAAGGAIADSGLVRVLDRGLAADGADAEGRSVGLTFQDDEGRWCRTFQAGRAGVAGLACRDEGDWRMRALAPVEAAGSEIRTAGADIPAPVLAAVDAAITGETLDGAAERRARDAGWPGSRPGG